MAQVFIDFLRCSGADGPSQKQNALRRQYLRKAFAIPKPTLSSISPSARRVKRGGKACQRLRGIGSILPEHPLQFLGVGALGQCQHGQQTRFFGAHIVGDHPVVLVVGLLGIAQHKAIGHA